MYNEIPMQKTKICTCRNVCIICYKNKSKLLDILILLKEKRNQCDVTPGQAKKSDDINNYNQ
jgi:hypothetical protein